MNVSGANHLAIAYPLNDQTEFDSPGTLRKMNCPHLINVLLGTTEKDFLQL